jgi:hypothetical protein
LHNYSFVQVGRILIPANETDVRHPRPIARAGPSGHNGQFGGPCDPALRRVDRHSFSGLKKFCHADRRRGNVEGVSGCSASLGDEYSGVSRTGTANISNGVSFII